MIKSENVKCWPSAVSLQTDVSISLSVKERTWQCDWRLEGVGGGGVDHCDYQATCWGKQLIWHLEWNLGLVHNGGDLHHYSTCSLAFSEAHTLTVSLFHSQPHSHLLERTALTLRETDREAESYRWLGGFITTPVTQTGGPSLYLAFQWETFIN